MYTMKLSAILNREVPLSEVVQLDGNNLGPKYIVRITKVSRGLLSVIILHGTLNFAHAYIKSLNNHVHASYTVVNAYSISVVRVCVWVCVCVWDTELGQDTGFCYVNV